MGGRVPLPCIALKHGADSDKPALFSISEKTAIDAEIPGMTNSNAWPTPRGWILIRDDTTTVLQNPQDPDGKIQLPHLPEVVHSRCACVLSGKPTIPGCVVLLVEPEDTIIWYCHIGGEDEEWARHDYDIGTQPLLPLVDGKGHEKAPITSIAACQGKFYFNGRFNSIRVLEFTPEPTFSFIAITEPLDFWGAASVFLVESEGELYMVSQLFDYNLEGICDVTVHKMDFSKHQWCTAEDIGGRTFLIAPCYFGASRSADECGLEKDCVYAIFARYKYFEVSKVEDGETKEYDLIEAPNSDIGMWILPIDG
uniref:KIB1-4 beta-propeller domain-containing protein n=1 Tax=Oryza meridionalis TaxID=40149 RepID=A0A0E0D7N8_9ORYZ